MRFILFTTTIFLITINSYSQNNGYNVIYEGVNKNLIIPDSELKPSKAYNRLVFNDSMSYNYGMRDNKDRMKKSKLYGSVVMHHDKLIDLHANIMYTGIGNDPLRKNYYVSLPVPPVRKWTFSNETKQILGYECKKAFIVNEYLKDSASVKVWQSDSTIVWYTEKFRVPFGPWEYFGLPGLVLGVYDDNYNGMYMEATKLEADKFTIAIPKKVQVMTWQQFKKN